MRFDLLANTRLDLQPQLQWLWFSNKLNAFVTGDERSSFSIPLDDPGSPKSLDASWRSGACNLPIPDELLDEFLAEPWHGFRLLSRAEYERAVDEKGNSVGDMLRTLVFGPDYGTYVLHPASGLILSLHSGQLQLLEQTTAGFKLLDQTRTRGRAALAFAAHPHESLITYGDNHGAVHAHRFEASGFASAKKIADLQRKVSRLEFTNNGQTLLVGGLGYLAAHKCRDGKFAAAAETSISVRDFTWCESERLLLVNQGMHGIAAYGFENDAFVKLGGVQPEFAVQQIAVSDCTRFLATSGQDASKVSIYTFKQE